VLIAEDVTKPAIFNKKLKSAYVDCLLYLKGDRVSSSIKQPSSSLDHRT